MMRSAKAVLLFRVVVAFLLASPSVTLAVPGRTIGEGDVSASGEATYTIPIVVPPGINGLTPDLAFVYAHRQREGLAGVGWGISGLSEINRCGKTLTQDGAPDTVNLTTSDRFCFAAASCALLLARTVRQDRSTGQNWIRWPDSRRTGSRATARPGSGSRTRTA